MKRSERNKVKTDSGQRHPSPNQNETDNHERRVSGSINVRGEIEAKRPPDLTHEHNTERTQDNAREKKKFVVEIATLFVVAIYAGLTWYQGCSTKKAADAAKNSADTAHDALVIGERPWIKIKHRIVKPLNFDFVGAAGPASTISIEDTLENVGNGVALDVVSWEDIIPLDPDMSVTSARKRQDEWCNANKKFDVKSPLQLNGYTLFPHDPFVQVSGIGQQMKTVEEAVTKNRANMSFLHPGIGPSPIDGKVAFAMVGCVVYRSQLDHEGTRPHVTGFLYHMGEPVPMGGIQPFVLPHGTADKLQLVKFPDGDYAY